MTNVFIEFEIIKKSNPQILYKELDILLATDKRIYVWSKTISPTEMRKHCLTSLVFLPKDELEIHKKAYNMRTDGSSYQEIAEETKIPLKQLGWYIRTNPDKQWTIDDWIADYYKKDSSVYSKVDAIIDNDEKIVERFKKKGILGNTIRQII